MQQLVAKLKLPSKSEINHFESSTNFDYKPLAIEKMSLELFRFLNLIGFLFE